MAGGTDTTTFKKNPRRATTPVKRVAVSEDMRKKYEADIREREERERTYGRHLSEENKGKR